MHRARKLAQQYYLVYHEPIPTAQLVQRIASVMQEYTQSGYVLELQSCLERLCCLNVMSNSYPVIGVFVEKAVFQWRMCTESGPAGGALTGSG